MASKLISNFSPELHANKTQQKQLLCQIANCSFEFLWFDNFFPIIKKPIFLSNHHGKSTDNNVQEGHSVNKSEPISWGSNENDKEQTQQDYISEVQKWGITVCYQRVAVCLPYINQELQNKHGRAPIIPWIGRMIHAIHSRKHEPGIGLA